MIRFDFVTMQWEGLTRDQIELWEHLYRNADVVSVLKTDIPRWIDKKVISREPLKVKAIARKKDWKKTICNWLQKENMKGAGL
jgi:hypothetical protein